MKRRRMLNVFGICGMVAAISVVAGSTSFPANFPNREIEIVVPQAAAGVTDVVCRIINDGLSKNLGVPVMVNNKGTGGGIGGMQYVAQSKPDGHTILIAAPSHMILRFLTEPNLPVKVSDFIPIAQFVTNAGVLFVRKDAPWKTIDEMIAFAKKNPGKLAIGCTGIGSSTHYNIELLKIEAGVDVINVPFDGGGPEIAGVLGGHADAGFVGFPAVASLLASGDLRALAVTIGKISQLPGLPSLKDKGYPKSGISMWYGLFVPKGVEKPVQEKIDDALKKTIQIPDVIRKLEDTGNQIEYLTGEELARKIKSDTETLAEVTKKVTK